MTRPETAPPRSSARTDWIKARSSKVNSTVKTAIFRITPEALNNIAKYSRASRVHLRVSWLRS